MTEKQAEASDIARGLDMQEWEHLLLAVRPEVVGLEVSFCPRLAELGLLSRNTIADAWKPTSLGYAVAALVDEVTP